MPKQLHLDRVYMNCALLHSQLSYAQRKTVGAVIVTSTGVVIPGYNGTPSGHNNCCENSEIRGGEWCLETKPTVLHAELNCILKAAKEGIPIVGATCYITLMPCQQCAAMLCQAGIKRVVYMQEYRDTAGLDVLKVSGIVVEQLKESDL